MQLVIGEITYNVIGAYTPLGWLAYAVFTGTVKADEFIYFINNFVKPYIANDHVCIIDNASIHRTAESVTSLTE